MEGVLRPLPVIDEINRSYWTAGADGVLRFQQCQDCKALLHPPQPVCRYCRSDDLGTADVAGTATVIGVSVNHQLWDPAFPPPYVVASVAIDEDPRVHVLTNLVDVDPTEVEVGQRVRVHFEQHEDVYLPLFRPMAEDTLDPGSLPDDEISAGDHAKHIRPMLRTDKFEDKVVLSGIGASRIGRRLMVPPLSLTVAAITAAVADAGLQLSDIDGLSTYPGMDIMGGFSEGGVSAVEDALGIRPTWYNGAFETFGPGGAVVSAMLAVAGGLARHVVCFRTVWQATFAAQQRAADPSAGSPYAIGSGGKARVPGFTAPYGLSSAAINLGLIASNYLKRYGATRETLGWIALNGRANAARNDEAIYRDPMSMDDYLSARMISTPFGLYDCDVPADASVAVIVSAAETAGDLASTPIFVEAVGTQVTERWAWDQSTMTHEPQTLGPAAHLWTRTSLRPDDVDVAEIYDGFTFNCVSWLEGLGLCGIGEAKDFLDGGTNIAPGGVVALNTHGGQLSAGRTHGMGFIKEAVTQLRGDGGERQVAGARVAVATTGGLSPSGALLLRGS